MPWMNLVGWGVTGLVLFIILNKMAPAPKSSPRFAFWLYLVNFALPLGFCILNRYWLAVLAGPSSIALAWFVFTRVWRGGLIKQDSPVSFAAGTAGLNCTTSQSDLTEDSRRRNETLTNFS